MEHKVAESEAHPVAGLAERFAGYPAVEGNRWLSPNVSLPNDTLRPEHSPYVIAPER